MTPNQLAEQATKSRVLAFGVPFDAASSHLRGPGQAPAAVRALFSEGMSNSWCESGFDLGDPTRFCFPGDIALRDAENTLVTYEDIEAAAAAVLAAGAIPLAVGGDHAVTVPLLRAMAAHGTKPTIVHFDAHPDLYDELHGDRFSHACPFARIMEEGTAARLIQVGIRTNNDHQRAQAAKFGVEQLEMRAAADALPLAPGEMIYVSFDLDALDPGAAPGVSHHEPGGFSVRQALDLLYGLPGPIVGADVVELNPARDPSGVTTAVAMKLVKEIAGLMLMRGREGG